MDVLGVDTETHRRAPLRRTTRRDARDDLLDVDVAAIFDPFGNAMHTALQFPCLGEDALVSGAGPIGIMASMVVLHAGARFVVVTDLSD